MGQPIIIDNQPGSGGTIGIGLVAHAEPDGYTILVQSNSYAVIPSTYKSLSFDVARDMVGVTALASVPMVLVTSPGKGARSLPDFVKMAKAKPGSMNYASAGTGGATHLGAERLNMVTLLGQRGEGAALLTHALLDARLALCAEAHGAMRALNRLTLAYLKDRRQFGRPIGMNQALQHRMVELYMLEQEAAAVIAAAQRAGGLAGPRRERAVMGAVAHAIAAARQISHEAVQMHGGIGTSDECGRRSERVANWPV